MNKAMRTARLWYLRSFADKRPDPVKAQSPPLDPKPEPATDNDLIQYAVLFLAGAIVTATIASLFAALIK